MKSSPLPDVFKNAESAIKNREYSKAESIYGAFLNSPDPDIRRESLYGLGRLNYYRNDFKNAKKNFKAALQVNSNNSRLEKADLAQTMAGIRVYLAYVDMQRKDYKLAITELQRAEKDGLVKLNRAHFLGSNIYSLMAKNYLRLGDVISAKKYFAKAYKIASTMKMPESDEANRIRLISLLGLGDCSLFLGAYEDAVSYFKEAIKINKEDNNFKISAYIGCSSGYLMNGEFEKAAGECAMQLEALPADVLKIPAMYNLAVIKLKQNKLQEAEDYFKKTLTKIASYNLGTKRANFSFAWNFYTALTQYSLAKLYISEKKFDQALVEINKALETLKKKIPSDVQETTPEKYLHIAAMRCLYEVLKAQGQADSAEETYKHMISLMDDLSPSEIFTIQKRRFTVFIEGKPLDEILRK